ncbi:histidine kinase [Paenibacillus sp. FSL R7-0273]|uniref:sensor histidine kinase n=1 Tax=Paenibacillus sp. FSL R7-0273 TaxID=1536772 RepID=UPI0004F5C2C5|nr:sensor histidine kinase [Paenibacillus sp. FSL R7-0273]AIQ48502.1 histidine kinase [Paenibacillus sp. FSL R7-0273]OMF86284.1 histidine kinase [Paenibacillus sp. FSL R7-0273]
MLVRYMISRKSWILFFISLLGVTDLLILLDQGVSVGPTSFIYLNSLYIILFIVFFIWRYRKETRYLAAVAKLQEVMAADWIECLPEPDNELDKITGHLLREASSHFKRKLSGVKDAQLIENDYIASWIHEIKTPLTAMKLIMAARQSDPDIRRIETEWLRIHLLVDRQLYLTRLPALESDYVLEQVSLQRLATEEVQELAPWCMEKNLAVLIEGDDATVVTDRKWCRFIIRQLLTNAIKYSPAGKSLTFNTNVTEQENVFLDLTDEGPGIQSHDLPRIFDKGFTGGNGRIHNASTGLGLYLAQTVAAKIGITLQVHSSQPQGTTMRMTFTDSNAFETVRRGQADNIRL